MSFTNLISAALRHSPKHVQIKPTTSGTSVVSDRILDLTARQSRDNCHCPQCLLYPSRHRRSYHIPSDIAIKNAYLNTENGDQVVIEWSDNHRGYLSIGQLSDVPKLLNPRTLLWDKSNFNPKWYDYQSVIHDLSVRGEFFKDFNNYGLCIIKNAPENDIHANTALCDKLELNIYHSHHGKAFVVEDSNLGESNREKSNQAYTNDGLSCHTDLPYVADVPHGFVFHCIQEASIGGGESFYVDGWNIAQYLKIKHPREYELLCKVPVLFRDNQKQIGNGEEGWDIYALRPTITEYPHMQIAYNNGVRYSLHWPVSAFDDGIFNGSSGLNFGLRGHTSGDAGIDMSEEEIKEFQDETLHALQLFGELTEKEEFRFEYKMRSGHMNVFNNYRVLHGRKSFSGTRKMGGCYFQFTEFVTQNRAPLELPNAYGMTLYPEAKRLKMKHCIV